MPAQVLDMKCPNCGASVTTAQNICNFCKSPVVISTFKSVADMPLPLVNKYARAYQETLKENPGNNELEFSLGACFLKLKLYDKAATAFEKALESNFDNADMYFYAAISLLGGKRPFLSTRLVIDKICSYMEAANAIEPKGIYYYFTAYVAHDYFKLKRINAALSYEKLYVSAEKYGVSEFDIGELQKVLNLEINIK